MSRLLHAVRWVLRAGGWQRITWPTQDIPPLWVRHPFDQWMTP